MFVGFVWAEAIIWTVLVYLLGGPLWACVIIFNCNMLVGAVTKNQYTITQALSGEFALMAKLIGESKQ